MLVIAYFIIGMICCISSLVFTKLVDCDMNDDGRFGFAFFTLLFWPVVLGICIVIGLFSGIIYSSDAIADKIKEMLNNLNGKSKKD